MLPCRSGCSARCTERRCWRWWSQGRLNPLQPRGCGHQVGCKGLCWYLAPGCLLSWEWLWGRTRDMRMQSTEISRCKASSVCAVKAASSANSIPEAELCALWCSRAGEQGWKGSRHSLRGWCFRLQSDRKRRAAAEIRRCRIVLKREHSLVSRHFASCK